jgi:hypothetical protein
LCLCLYFLQKINLPKMIEQIITAEIKNTSYWLLPVPDYSAIYASASSNSSKFIESDESGI